MLPNLVVTLGALIIVLHSTVPTVLQYTAMAAMPYIQCPPSTGSIYKESRGCGISVCRNSKQVA